MPSHNRSNPGNSSGPPRYPGTFLMAFRDALGALNWKAERWMGDAVACLDANGDEHVVGLENLFRRARREEREQWPALIQDFLSRIRAAETTGEQERDLATVADQLLVRFGLPFTSMPNQLKVWSRNLEGTSLGINLVIDQPDTMVYVTEEMVAESGRPGEDWYQRALANLRERTPADCLEIVHEESGLRLCNVGDAYDSSRALILDHLLPDAQEMGAFAAVPSRDELLVLPVSMASLPQVHLLKMLAAKSFSKAPYAITDEVFWVHGGSWRVFPIDIRKEEVAVKPPREFLDLLDRLSPESTDEKKQDSGEERPEDPSS
jgi:hypothetical protein